MEEIKHNKYAPGLQSLEHVGLDGRRFSVGIVLPGEPYSTETTEIEEISVIDNGILQVSFEAVFWQVTKAESAFVPAGKKVILRALGAPVSYRCVYANVIPCMDEQDLRAVAREAKRGRLFSLVLKSGKVVQKELYGIIEESHNQPTRIRTMDGREFELKDVARLVLMEP